MPFSAMLHILAAIARWFITLLSIAYHIYATYFRHAMRLFYLNTRLFAAWRHVWLPHGLQHIRPLSLLPSLFFMPYAIRHTITGTFVFITLFTAGCRAIAAYAIVITILLFTPRRSLFTLYAHWSLYAIMSLLATLHQVAAINFLHAIIISIWLLPPPPAIIVAIYQHYAAT